METYITPSTDCFGLDIFWVESALNKNDMSKKVILPNNHGSGYTVFIMDCIDDRIIYEHHCNCQNNAIDILFKIYFQVILHSKSIINPITIEHAIKLFGLPYTSPYYDYDIYDEYEAIKRIFGMDYINIDQLYKNDKNQFGFIHNHNKSHDVNNYSDKDNLGKLQNMYDNIFMCELFFNT
jgi:hypothetical protein